MPGGVRGREGEKGKKKKRPEIANSDPATLVEEGDHAKNPPYLFNPKLNKRNCSGVLKTMKEFGNRRCTFLSSVICCFLLLPGCRGGG